jgi:hypothetical protein
MPLAEIGVGASAVGDFWAAQPFDLGLPNMNGKTMHGNCDLCFLKPASQVQSLIAEKPDRAVWWAKQEAKARSAGIGVSGSLFRDDRLSYAAMKLMAEQQHDFIGHTDEEPIACFCGD